MALGLPIFPPGAALPIPDRLLAGEALGRVVPAEELEPFASLYSLADQILQRWRSKARSPAAPEELPVEVRESLEALGYVQ